MFLVTWTTAALEASYTEDRSPSTTRPPMDETLMMRPPPRSLIRRAARWATKYVPRRLMDSVVSNSSGVALSASLRRETPALLTTMPGNSSAASSASKALSMLSSELASISSGRHSTPFSSRYAQHRRAASRLTSEAMIRAPAEPSARHCARPSPPAAPVTRAVRPSREKRSCEVEVVVAGIR